MAQRNNSYARQARAELTEARRARERVETEERAERRKANEQRGDEMQKLAEVFDALEVGDNLAEFGMPARFVIKKNRKSIVSDCGGHRWTRYELTGVK